LSVVTLNYRYVLYAVITVKLSVLQCKPDGIVLLVSQAVAQNLHNLSVLLTLFLSRSKLLVVQIENGDLLKCSAFSEGSTSQKHKSPNLADSY